MAIELLDNLLEEAVHREEWSFISGLVQLQEEAEHLPFVNPLPCIEKQYILRGLAHRVQGEREAAITDYSNAIAINPNNALTYVIRGSLYAEQERYKEALVEYNHAIKL